MRQYANINISRFNSDNWGGMQSLVATVPITQGSRRKFHLMGEDSITLVFSLAEPKEFKIGDFIRDEVFGLFMLCEKQLPTYNKTTGGYDYQLRFDRAYKLWENHILMLSAPLGDASVDADEEDGTTEMQIHDSSDMWKRQEAIWCLTAPLRQHLEQVLCNLVAAGLNYYGRPYKVRIHSTATKAKEVRFINYNAVHICSALTTIANEYECEWWVTYETENNVEYGWLNFGKCELDNTPVEFVLGDNVETMTASRDLTNYANRLYAFGGTKNIPESYRRKLFLDIDTMDTTDGVESFSDSTKRVNPYTMLLDEGEQAEAKTYAFGQVALTPQPMTPSANRTITMTAETDLAIGGGQMQRLSWNTITATLLFKITPPITDVVVVTCSFTATLALVDSDDNKTEFARITETRNYDNGSGYDGEGYAQRGFYASFAAGSVALVAGKTYKVVLEATMVYNSDRVVPDQGSNVTGYFSYPSGKTFAATVKWEDTLYPVTFNPHAYLQGDGREYSFKFDDGTPQGFCAYDAQVEWLESNGTGGRAYIDTGVKVSDNIQFEVKVANIANADAYLFGGRTANNSNMLYVRLVSGTKRVYWHYGNVSNLKAVSSIVTTFTFKNTSAANSLVWGSNTLTTTNYSLSAINHTLYLFAINNGGNVTQGGSADIRIYYAKIWDNGVLVRDFIPVRRGDIGYMYDQVSGELFGNANSAGAFTFGNDVESDVEGGVNQAVELFGYRTDMVESAWYSDNTDDPSALIGLGDRRLRLPFYVPESSPLLPTNGYVETLNTIEVQRVEMSLIVDNIYPRCYLRVTDIRTESKTERVVYADGTEYEFPWTAYILQAELIDGSEFPFRRTYVKEGEKLQAMFLSDYDEQKAYEEQDLEWDEHEGYLLAGMTFDVGFRESPREYTLIRNEEYGAKLPSSVLMPKVGDTFILTGWNVEAMSDLGLIDAAENQLWEFASTYLDAIQKDGWNFRCNMMSVENGALLPEGTKVEVMHDALVGGSKVSRIIGYELKLDIPYDSPIYEVGETEAYSRIKQLERKIQKL